MKKISQLILITLIILIAGCKCDETQSCEGVSPEGIALLPTELGGATFQSTSGRVINIISRTNQIQEATEEECNSGSNGCECDACPNKIGRITYGLTPFFSSDVIKTSIQGGTTRDGVFFPNDTCIFITITRNEEIYNTTIEENSSSDLTFQIDFLGFSYAFNVERDGGGYSLASNADNSQIELLPTFSTPEQTYENVLLLNRGASRLSSTSEHLIKLYYSTSEGIVAYESIQNELFYVVK